MVVKISYSLTLLWVTLVPQLASAQIGSTASASNQESKIPAELSEHQRQLIRLRIDHILEKDQQFRSYTSWGTTDDAEIERIGKLTIKEQFAAMSDNRDKLNPEVKAVLVQLQRKNDRETYAEFYDIVGKYGYPSPDRIGVEHDRLFAILLHPPVALEEIEPHMERMSKLLLPEVRAGRMEPKIYASFIDNMLGKILRRPQLYGTNKQFDRKTGKVLPPAVSNIDDTNRARREIGMPELKSGEYRLVNPQEYRSVRDTQTGESRQVNPG